MKKTGILVINETSFIINDGLTFIGRDPVTCSIILANVTISKQHALAIKINDNFYISDLQSTNGTKLEEVSLQPRFCYEIIDNATLTFGDVKCKFIIQEYNAIFKTPTALSKKSAASSKVSLNTTKLLSTNIHELPTQLEDGFQDCTQQILDKSVEETQILESSIIETPNISKIRSNISRTKNIDDFIIPETQSENFYQETQKHYEIDESNNSDQFELSNLEISDTQMAEVHDSIIQSPSKHKNFISKRKQSDKIHNLETQNINEAETQLEFDSPKASNTRNLPTQNLASSASSKTLNIYEMETQQFEETSPSSKKHLHEAETQVDTPQFRKPQQYSSANRNIYEAETQVDIEQFEEPQKPSSPDRNIYEAETQVDIEQFEKPQKPSSHNKNIYEAETQVDTQQFKKPQNPSSPNVTSSKNSETQLLEDRIDLNSGEPHAENENLIETQFEFDAEPNIETPKLKQVETTHMEEKSEEIRDVKRVIGKNRAINFTQDNSQIIESQSEPEMPGMKKHVIGNSKPINFTESPTVQIDLNETQFDEFNIPEIQKQPKKSLNSSSFFSDSDSSLNNSVKSNIRNIIKNFEAASKNTSNTSTPNRSSVEDRSGSFVSHKINKSVETIITGIPNKVPNDVFVEIESNSVSNCLNDNISNTSVQHKAFYKTKTVNKVVEEIKDNEISLTDTPKSTPSTSKTVENFDTIKKPNLDIDNMLDDSTQLMDSENCNENGKDIDNFADSTQNIHVENDAEDLPTPINKQPPFLTFKTPTSVRRGTSTFAENDSIFDQSTIILTNEQIDSPSSNFITPKINVLKKLRDSTFSTPLPVRTNQKNVSSDTSSSDVEIYDMATQVMEKPSIEEKQPSEQTDSDLFDMPTQVMTNKSVNKIDRESEKPESNYIFDIPTQAMETVTNNSPNKKTSQPSVSKSSNTVETDDIFDIPTQALETGTNISPNKQAKKTSQPGVSKSSKTVDTDDIFDIPTQALETGTNISPNKQAKKTSQPGVSKSSKTVDTDDIFDIPTQALETGTNISPNKQAKKTSQPGVSKSSNTVETNDIFDIPTPALKTGINISSNKQAKKTSQPGVSKASNTVETNDIFDVPTQAFETVKKNSPKAFDTNISQLSEKLLHDEDLENILNNDPKTPEMCNVAASSSTDDLSINTKPAKRRTRKPSESSTRKMTRKTINRGNPKQAHRSSSSNQSTSAKDSDRETAMVNQSPNADGSHETGKKNIDKSSNTADEGKKRNLRGSSNQSTSAKDSDRSPDKRKSGKKSKQNKPKDGPEHETSKDSDNDNKVLERLEMVVTTTKEVINTKINGKNQSDRADVGQTSSNRPTLIKLTRKTTNQQATESTNDPTVEVSSTRPVRKSKIPLKFRMDSQSEESCIERSSRKRGHPVVPEQSSSESIDSAISSKIQKLGTNCKPTRSKFQVMFTIFRDAEQEQTVKKLGGKLVEKSKDANVLVTNQIKRSVKLLNAISQGIPIVSPRWLDVCKHAKNFVDPWDYLLDDLEAEKRFKFRLKDSLNIAKENGLLFQGYTALLTKSIPTDLKDILENAGAKCISSWPKNATDKHIIVSSMEDKSQWPKQSKVIIVAAEAIFSAVINKATPKIVQDISIFDKQDDDNKTDKDIIKEEIKKLFGEGADSSDDEDARNHSSTYNSFGKEIKKLLKTSTSSTPSFSGENKRKELTWKSLPPGGETLSATYDPVFGLRISNPVISSTLLRERMADKQIVEMRNIQAFIQLDTVKNSDWVIAGVIVHKSDPRVSQKGSKYSVWSVSDLKDDLKTVSVFLFKNAHNQLWKLAVGTVIAILNADVLERRNGSKDEASLSLNNADRVMILGQSKDLGFCKSKKKNGDICNAFVNLRACAFCIYHMKQEYNKFSRRSELQSSTTGGRGLLALRNKVLGKNEVFYAGKSYMAIPAKKNHKQIAKDEERLKALEKKSLILKNSPPNNYKINKNAAHVEISNRQRAKDLERLRSLGVPIEPIKEKLQESPNISLNEARENARKVLSKLNPNLSTKIDTNPNKNEKMDSTLSPKIDSNKYKPISLENKQINSTISLNNSPKIDSKSYKPISFEKIDSTVSPKIDQKNYKPINFENSKIDSIVSPKIHPSNYKPITLENKQISCAKIESNSLESKSKTLNVSRLAKIRVNTESNTSSDVKHDTVSKPSDLMKPKEPSSKPKLITSSPSSETINTSRLAKIRVNTESKSLTDVKQETILKPSDILKPKEIIPKSKLNTSSPCADTKKSTPKTPIYHKPSEIMQICKTNTLVDKPILQKTSNGSINLLDTKSTIPNKLLFNRSRINALKYIAQNGPIEKVDPMNLKGTKSKKRILEQIESPETKKSKVEELSIKSERFKQIMEAKSINQHLIEEADSQAQDEYFNKLEVKERIEEKMANTFKVPCKAVQCIQCKYTAFSASEMCKSEQHPLRVIDTMKRFFQCHDCSNRTVTLEIIPLISCTKCGKSNWKKSSMLREKIVQHGEKLSLRGDEEQFIGANVANANVNLLVPE
ncbi:uncharacterized protein LOC123293031 [Chrysoperla carnea]|uniref:uncharacterized protein LOC123293031 n=1 Tax=Chrysoperla carnea TaxID=189513 RepID=UPI001D08DD87|nr:uncharacterized protein LOC123293031 [Chrysoperla carnea]